MCGGVRTHIIENVALPSVHIFLHSAQVLYSVMKEGVDSCAKMHSLLSNRSVTPSWQRKMVTETLNLVTQNAFITWRMVMLAYRLSTKETVGTLGEYKHCLNNFQSLGFILDSLVEFVAANSA